MRYFKLKIKVVIPTSTTLSAATRDCEWPHIWRM